MTIQLLNRQQTNKFYTIIARFLAVVIFTLTAYIFLYAAIHAADHGRCYDNHVKCELFKK